MGEIGYNRHEFLYDLRLWEIHLIVMGYRKRDEGVTEGTKEHDQMAWVGAMNSIRNRAKEIVLREMIYEEDAV